MGQLGKARESLGNSGFIWHRKLFDYDYLFLSLSALTIFDFSPAIFRCIFDGNSVHKQLYSRCWVSNCLTRKLHLRVFRLDSVREQVDGVLQECRFRLDLHVGRECKEVKGS